MKKHKPAFLPMLLSWTGILITIGLFGVFFVVKGWFIDPQKDTNMLTIASDFGSFVLLVLELCAIVIVLIGLHLHFRRYRPPVFIFEGFSNVSKLSDAESQPIDLDSLAREEMIYQFKIIYKQLKDYYYENVDSTQQSSIAQNKQDSGYVDMSFLVDLEPEEIHRPEDKAHWILPTSDILGAEKIEALLMMKTPLLFSK